MLAKPQRNKSIPKNPQYYLCWTHLEKNHWQGLSPPLSNIEKQLQYLPLPLLDIQDRVITADPEPKESDKNRLISWEALKTIHKQELRPLELLSFAWNYDLYDFCTERSIAPRASWRWKHLLQRHQLAPIKELNSKSFLQKHYEKTPHLQNQLRSARISDSQELKEIGRELDTGVDAWRIKPLFGHAGRDHLLVSLQEELAYKKIDLWLERQKKAEEGFVAIIEENKPRFADLSTFWEILPDQSILCTGYSFSFCSDKGRYLGAWVFPQLDQASPLQSKAYRSWQEHIIANTKESPFSEICLKKALRLHIEDLLNPSGLLKVVAATQYCGPVTIDSYVTCKREKNSEPIILPCDLNARMSYGRVMIEILRKKQPKAEKYYFSTKSNSLIQI